jgi:DNA polymerase/3'-5' exonuclease PolX
MTTEARRHTLEDALRVANVLKAMLLPFVERIEIVGSIRRRRPFPKDVELLFIPKYALKSADLFSVKASEMKDLADAFINSLEETVVLRKRLSVTGVPAWGKENKLAVHIETGIPVDFFATTEDKWWNSLVVRTGGKKTNIAIATAAQKKGYSLEAYGTGFRSLCLGCQPHHRTTSEADVFEFVGLPFLSPPQRP